MPCGCYLVFHSGLMRHTVTILGLIKQVSQIYFVAARVGGPRSGVSYLATIRHVFYLLRQVIVLLRRIFSEHEIKFLRPA